MRKVKNKKKTKIIYTSIQQKNTIFYIFFYDVSFNFLFFFFFSNLVQTIKWFEKSLSSVNFCFGKRLNIYFCPSNIVLHKKKEKESLKK